MRCCSDWGSHCNATITSNIQEPLAGRPRLSRWSNDVECAGSRLAHASRSHRCPPFSVQAAVPLQTSRPSHTRRRAMLRKLIFKAEFPPKSETVFPSVFWLFQLIARCLPAFGFCCLFSSIFFSWHFLYIYSTLLNLIYSSFFHPLFVRTVLQHNTAHMRLLQAHRERSNYLDATGHQMEIV